MLDSSENAGMNRVAQHVVDDSFGAAAEDDSEQAGMSDMPSSTIETIEQNDQFHELRETPDAPPEQLVEDACEKR